MIGHCGCSFCDNLKKARTTPSKRVFWLVWCPTNDATPRVRLGDEEVGT